MALGQMERQNETNRYVLQKVTNVHQDKIINMMSESHVNAVCEKIEVRHFISISHIPGKLFRNLV